MKKHYIIDLGNSSSGQVGAVARIAADSPEEALERFKSEAGYDGYDVESGNGFDVRVYLNPDAVTLDDVEEDES